MHIALVIYGSLDEVSGGFLYDRKLVEHLQQRGHEVTVIPLPWRSYEWSLVDNGSHRLLRRMQSRDFAVIVQDELIHPSVFQLNQRLRRVVQTPIVALIHLLRSSQHWPVWQQRLTGGWSAGISPPWMGVFARTAILLHASVLSSAPFCPVSLHPLQGIICTS